MENNRIPLKTDERHYESDDFIQTECGTMKELTVTITLHEYRQLIKDLAYWQNKAVLNGEKARQLQTKICMKAEEQFIKENPDA